MPRWPWLHVGGEALLHPPLGARQVRQAEVDHLVRQHPVAPQLLLARAGPDPDHDRRAAVAHGRPEAHRAAAAGDDDHEQPRHGEPSIVAGDVSRRGLDPGQHSGPAGRDFARKESQLHDGAGRLHARGLEGAEHGVRRLGQVGQLRLVRVAGGREQAGGEGDARRCGHAQAETAGAAAPRTDEPRRGRRQEGSLLLGDAVPAVLVSGRLFEREAIAHPARFAGAGRRRERVAVDLRGRPAAALPDLGVARVAAHAVVELEPAGGRLGEGRLDPQLTSALGRLDGVLGGGRAVGRGRTWGREAHRDDGDRRAPARRRQAPHRRKLIPAGPAPAAGPAIRSR